jgi:hypothetical protein
MNSLALKKFEDIISLVENKTKMHSELIFLNGKDFSDGMKSVSKLVKILIAIANSGGGEVFIGISTKNKRADKIIPVRNFNFSIDWLMNEIQSEADPKIKDLFIDYISVYEKGEEKIIYFRIPFANGQPHMYSDFRYYKFEKLKVFPLTEKEIRMLYGFNRTSDIELLGIYNTNGLPVLQSGKFASMTFYPKILIRNSGNIIEKDYKVEISFPVNLYEENFLPLQSNFIRHDGNYIVFGITGRSPLFQNETSTIIEAKLSVNQKNYKDYESGEIRLILYYGSGVKKYNFKISEILTYNGKILQKNDFVDLNQLPTFND